MVSSPLVKTLFWSLLGAGLATLFALPVVFAQTFDDPACDPKLDPALCNKPTPIFSVLNPVSGQIIKTPLQIGEAGTPQSLTLRGGLVLGQANAGITRASLPGIGVDVQSSDNYAISGQSNGSVTTGGVWGSGTGSARGLVGISTNGDALYANPSGSGRAAYLEGAVQIGALLSGGKAGNLTIGSSAVPGSLVLAKGNATITDGNVALTKGNLTLNNGNLAVTGTITVNGKPVASGNQQTLILTTPLLNNGQNKIFTAQDIIGYPVSTAVGPYRVANVQLFASTGGPSRTWTQPTSAQATLTYTECTLGNFTGSLRVNNLAFGANTMFKVQVVYTLESEDCSNADITAPSVSVTSIGGNAPAVTQSVAGTVSIVASASDTGGSNLKNVELFIDGSPTSPPLVITTAPFNFGLITTAYADGVHTLTLKATDNAGNSTTTPALNLNVSNSGGTPCGPFICGGSTPQCCNTCGFSCHAAGDSCVSC